jgi:hypothetical protein
MRSFFLCWMPGKLEIVCCGFMVYMDLRTWLSHVQMGMTVSRHGYWSFVPPDTWLLCHHSSTKMELNLHYISTLGTKQCFPVKFQRRKFKSEFPVTKILLLLPDLSNQNKPVIFSCNGLVTENYWRNIGFEPITVKVRNSNLQWVQTFTLVYSND